MPNADDIRIIEFCGLPGSGKSTLEKLLINELRLISGRPVMDRQSMVDCCLRRRDEGFIKNTFKHLPGFVWKRFLGLEYALPELHLFASVKPLLMAQIFGNLAHFDVSNQVREGVLYAIFQTILEHCLASSYLKNEILVADEGFVHRCFTVFGYLRYSVPDDDILRFVDAIPLPDSVIHIEASPKVCEDRLAHRAAYPLLLSNLSFDDRMNQLRIGSERLRIAVGQVERHGVAIFRIENDDPLESNDRKIRQIANELADAWNHPRQSTSTKA